MVAVTGPTSKESRVARVQWKVGTAISTPIPRSRRNSSVHAKRLPPRIATGVAPLFNTLLRSLDTEEQEKRLRSLEEKIKKLENEGGERFSGRKAASAGSGSTG